MKITKLNAFLRTILLNVFMIIIFAIIYLQISNEFVLLYKEHLKVTFIDCLFMSTNIQSSTGMTTIMPITNRSKSYIIIHQLVTIICHLLSAIFVIFV